MDLLQQAQKLAALKGTEIIAHRFGEDGTITFVLASGSKLTMDPEQLHAAIREAQPDEPFDYIETAVAEEQPKPKKGKGKK